MGLHNSNKVIIPREKLIDYILSEIHSTGKFKAKYFRNIGFNETNIHLFEKALRQIAKSEEVKDEIISEYGTKYIVDGKIHSPTKQTVRVTTVWIIEKGQNRPRFVTVYPV